MLGNQILINKGIEYYVGDSKMERAPQISMFGEGEKILRGGEAPSPLYSSLQPIRTQAFYYVPGRRGVRGEAKPSTKYKQNHEL